VDVKVNRLLKPEDSDAYDRELALALRRLVDASEPPPIDPRREAALMAAFDAAPRTTAVRRPYWGLAGLAAAAAVLMAVGLTPLRAGRHGLLPDGRAAMHKPLPSSGRGVRPEASPGDFVIVPGAAALPPLESGSLVRMDVPVSLLPSLGLTPPSTTAAKVKADLIVGQDGLTRAVRLVN
jgi:hypothetical protein